MDEPRNFHHVVDEIYGKDSRYKPDAYEFTMQALHFTQNRLKRSGHVKAAELLEGVRDFAIEQFGPMAETVLSHWGISRTDDFGHIVFNLIEQRVLFKTETDSLDDFKEVYDFSSVFKNALRESILKNFKAR